MALAIAASRGSSELSGPHNHQAPHWCGANALVSRKERNPLESKLVAPVIVPFPSASSDLGPGPIRFIPAERVVR